MISLAESVTYYSSRVSGFSNTRVRKIFVINQTGTPTPASVLSDTCSRIYVYIYLYIYIYIYIYTIYVYIYSENTFARKTQSFLYNVPAGVVDFTSSARHHRRAEKHYANDVYADTSQTTVNSLFIFPRYNKRETKSSARDPGPLSHFGKMLNAATRMGVTCKRVPRRGLHRLWENSDAFRKRNFPFICPRASDIKAILCAAATIVLREIDYIE